MKTIPYQPFSAPWASFLLNIKDLIHRLRDTAWPQGDIGGLDGAPVGPGGFIAELPGQPFELPSGVEIVRDCRL